CTDCQPKRQIAPTDHNTAAWRHSVLGPFSSLSSFSSLSTLSAIDCHLPCLAVSSYHRALVEELGQEQHQNGQHDSQEDERRAAETAGRLADNIQRGSQRLDQEEDQRSTHQGHYGPRLPPAHAAQEGKSEQAKGQRDDGQIQPNSIKA